MLIWFEIHFKLVANKEFTCDTTYDYFIFKIVHIFFWPFNFTLKNI